MAIITGDIDQFFILKCICHRGYLFQKSNRLVLQNTHGIYVHAPREMFNITSLNEVLFDGEVMSSIHDNIINLRNIYVLVWYNIIELSSNLLKINKLMYCSLRMENRREFTEGSCGTFVSNKKLAYFVEQNL